MRKIGLKERIDGDIAMRQLNSTAYNIYVRSAPLQIGLFADGTFAMRGIFGDYDFVTFDVIEQHFLNIARSSL